MTNKTCCECSQTFSGRSDKKFCDDHCRNAHNNKLNSNSSSFIRNINNALRKNRRILEKLVTSNTLRVPLHELAIAGFNFSFHTQSKITTQGKTYFYCYDYGYTIANLHCVIIKKISNDKPIQK